jgi:Protein of unknown function (DUF998)
VDAAFVVRCGVATFVAIVAAEHLLRTDLPPADHFVSEYGRGWTQPLQVVAFVAWAASMAAAARLATHLDRTRPFARALVAGALAVAAAGTLLTAAFATQTIAGELPPGEVRTVAGRLHDTGTLLILAGLLLAALASLRLVRARGYRLTVVALGVLLLAVVPVLVALGLDAPGAGQRAFILLGCAWQWRFSIAAERT